MYLIVERWIKTRQRPEVDPWRCEGEWGGWPKLWPKAEKGDVRAKPDGRPKNGGWG